MKTAFLLVLLPLTGCVGAVPPTAAPAARGPAPSAPPSVRVADRNSLELVADALQRGEIDEETATVYRVLAVTDDAKLPPQYRGSLPIRDGATILRSARDRYRSLRPETRALLRPYLYPKGEQ